MFGYAPALGQISLSELATRLFAPEETFIQLENGVNSFFRIHVTMELVKMEDIFKPLYADDGSPSVSPALIMAGEIFEDHACLPDRKFIELIHGDPVVQYALGIRGLYGEGCKPWCRDTISEFRRRVKEYEEETGINLKGVVFHNLADAYGKSMGITTNLLL